MAISPYLSGTCTNNVSSSRQDNSTQTPLNFSDQKTHEIWKHHKANHVLMINKDVYIKRIKTQLSDAIICKKEKEIFSILDEIKSLNKTEITIFDEIFEKLLKWSILWKQKKLMDYLLSNKLIKNLNQAFIYSCEIGNLHSIKELIKIPQVNPSIQDNQALIQAITNLHLSVVEFLSNHERISLDINTTYLIKTLSSHIDTLTIYKNLYTKLIKIQQIKEKIGLAKSV